MSTALLVLALVLLAAHLAWRAAPRVRQWRAERAIWRSLPADRSTILELREEPARIVRTAVENGATENLYAFRYALAGEDHDRDKYVIRIDAEGGQLVTRVARVDRRGKRTEPGVTVPVRETLS